MHDVVPILFGDILICDFCEDFEYEEVFVDITTNFTIISNTSSLE